MLITLSNEYPIIPKDMNVCVCFYAYNTPKTDYYKCGIDKGKHTHKNKLHVQRCNVHKNVLAINRLAIFLFNHMIYPSVIFSEKIQFYD